MKKIRYKLSTKVLVAILIFCASDLYSAPRLPDIYTENNMKGIRRQVRMDGNNTETWVQNTGTFNQDIRTNNTPGFMWPRGANRFSTFTSGLCIGTVINGELKLANASYNGEYTEGYIENGVPMTDNRFKLYKIKAGDNAINNPDYANWGLMVPFGAPFIDSNSNGAYEVGIDAPGIANAKQVIFVCLTDGFPENHSSGEGFSGGTAPIMAEVHLTIWCYDTQGLDDAQFIKWEVINKGPDPWTRTHFTFFSDADLGSADDDYIGCDTSNLRAPFGFCYNADNMDGNGNPPSYGTNPPAVGYSLLRTPVNRSVSPFDTLGMTSFVYCNNASSGGLTCEREPELPSEAFNFMHGLKKDSTPWLYPANSQPTKYCYPGDPESQVEWSERGTDGVPTLAHVNNCGGALTGQTGANFPGDRRLLMNMGAGNFTVAPGESQIIYTAQFVARGSNNFSAVTRLKNLASTIYNFYGLSVGISEITGTEIPLRYTLSQNYPNPFNPSTKIKFEVPALQSTGKNLIQLKIYNTQGQEIAVLVNRELAPGIYEAEWNAGNFPSGIYFYKISTSGGTEDFQQTRKMILIK